MAETKNLCAQIDLALHAKVCEGRERTGQTTSQYITQLLTEYYEMKENGGKRDMDNNGSRTMAFQIPEELFQRIKRYLERESDRLGRRVTQREFVLDLITKALDASEATVDSYDVDRDVASPTAEDSSKEAGFDQNLVGMQ